MNDTTTLIQIKGIRDGLLVTLGDATWSVLQASLISHIDERQAFFSGARLALDVGNQPLHVAELSQLRDELSGRGVSLWAVLSESPTTENTAQMLGLATRLTKGKPAPAVPESPPEDAALWIHRTVRSGTRIEYPGNIIVVGDVNPGAEIIAGGSVVVWGRLRGVVHAGAQGNDKAVVCALDLSPTQLRIAGEMATTPRRQDKPDPEQAFLKDGHLVAEAWQPEK
jgi:septum site-determining protein MinC